MGVISAATGAIGKWPGHGTPGVPVMDPAGGEFKGAAARPG